MDTARKAQDAEQTTSRRRWIHSRLSRLAFRVAAATVIAWLIATAPVPRVEPYLWFAYVQVPAAIFLLICYLGKLLIDTFFYDHYRP